MDVLEMISLYLCFANIWPEAVMSGEESSLCSCLFFSSGVQAPLLFAEQCSLPSVQWLTHYIRNRFYQLQNTCGVDDDLTQKKKIVTESQEACQAEQLNQEQNISQSSCCNIEESVLKTHCTKFRSKACPFT